MTDAPLTDEERAAIAAAEAEGKVRRIARGVMAEDASVTVPMRESIRRANNIGKAEHTAKAVTRQRRVAALYAKGATVAEIAVTVGIPEGEVAEDLRAVRERER